MHILVTLSYRTDKLFTPYELLKRVIMNGGAEKLKLSAIIAK